MATAVTMIEFQASQGFSEPELDALFGRYLPLAPLPTELAMQLRAIVLAEVALKIRRRPLVRQFLTWLTPRHLCKSWWVRCRSG